MRFDRIYSQWKGRSSLDDGITLRGALRNSLSEWGLCAMIRNATDAALWIRAGSGGVVIQELKAGAHQSEVVLRLQLEGPRGDEPYAHVRAARRLALRCASTDIADDSILERRSLLLLLLTGSPFEVKDFKVGLNLS